MSVLFWVFPYCLQMMFFLLLLLLGNVKKCCDVADSQSVFLGRIVKDKCHRRELYVERLNHCLINDETRVSEQSSKV